MQLYGPGCGHAQVKCSSCAEAKRDRDVYLVPDKLNIPPFQITVERPDDQKNQIIDSRMLCAKGEYPSGLR